jgi:hypothetical protein
LDVRALASTGSNVFAGTFGAGVFVSSTSVINWTAANTGLTYKRINALAVKGPYLFAGADRKGLFRSDDNGITWNSANSGISGEQVIALGVNGNDIYVSTNMGIFQSTNNGSTWTKVNFGFENNFVQAFAFFNGSIFLPYINLNGSASVLTSSDKGLSWKDVGEGLPDMSIFSLDVAGDYMFAGTFGLGIWKRRLSELSGNNGLYSDSQIIVYPNPIKNKFIVEKSLQLPNANLSITNVNGQKLLERKITDHKTPIDISNLRSGIYFIRMTSEKTVDLLKIIKE